MLMWTETVELPEPPPGIPPKEGDVVLVDYDHCMSDIELVIHCLDKGIKYLHDKDGVVELVRVDNEKIGFYVERRKVP